MLELTTSIVEQYYIMKEALWSLIQCVIIERLLKINMDSLHHPAVSTDGGAVSFLEADAACGAEGFYVFVVEELTREEHPHSFNQLAHLRL